MAMTVKNTQIPQDLPKVGKSRWEQLKHFVSVSRETWRKLGLQGKAPQPQRISQRCTVFDNAEIHKWLADPQGYSVEVGGK